MAGNLQFPQELVKIELMQEPLRRLLQDMVLQMEEMKSTITQLEQRVHDLENP